MYRYSAIGITIVLLLFLGLYLFIKYISMSEKSTIKGIIHNPVTGTDYEVRSKSTKYETKDEITGILKTKTKGK